MSEQEPKAKWFGMSKERARAAFFVLALFAFLTWFVFCVPVKHDPMGTRGFAGYTEWTCWDLITGTEGRTTWTYRP